MTIALIILFCCMVAVCWWSVVCGAAVVLFLLPTYQLRFTVFGMPTTILELLLVALLVVWVVRRIFYREGRSFSKLPWRWALPLLLLSAVIAVYVSPDREGALGYLKAYFVEPIAFFILLWDRIRTEKATRVIIHAIGASALLLSLIACAQIVGLFPSPDPWIHETPKRVASIFTYPNALGLYLSSVVAFFAAFALFPDPSTRQKFRRWFPIVVACIGLVAILGALSRGAVLGVGAACVFLGAVSIYRRWIFGAVAIIALFILLVPATRSMVVGVVTGTDVSTDVRTVLWQGTARLLVDRPLMGAGLGGFPILYDQYRLAKHTELPLYPHNIILNAWVELGLAGLLVFCWLMIDAIRRISFLLRNTLSPFQRQLCFAVLAALVAMVIHGVVDVPYFKNDLAVLFWFFLALIPITGRLSTSGQKP